MDEAARFRIEKNNDVKDGLEVTKKSSGDYILEVSDKVDLEKDDDMWELFAEKFRAALTRREPAIRDYFDIFYAIRNLDIDFESNDFLTLIKGKLKIPGNDSISICELRKKQLQDQIETEGIIMSHGPDGVNPG